MITSRTHTYPGLRSGYECRGKVTTDSGGAATITVKGRDFSSKIVGLSFTCFDNVTTNVMYSVNIVSISYDSSTLLTTITINAVKLATDDTQSAFEGVVHYSFWVDDEKQSLPADLSTNDTNKQAY